MIPAPDGPTPAEFELRFAIDPEIRAEDAAQRRMVGYAASFDTPAKIRTWAGEFEETIARGAFADSLKKRGDVRFLLEHDPRALLARTSAGNLVLTEDQRGLRFEATLPDTQLGRDTYEQVRVGNLKGMSFGFTPMKTKTAYDDRGRLRSVTLEAVDLREVTITSLPAYPRTSVALRSLLAPRVPDTREARLRLLRLGA
jgi:uncharacterized protein